MYERIENWLGQSVDALTNGQGIDDSLAKHHASWFMTLISLGVIVYVSVSMIIPYFGR